MNVQSIGENAGIIWRLLQSESRKWDYQEIKKETGLSDRDINTAIGWLAREDKVYFETDKNSTEFLYLCVNVYY